MGDNCQTDGNDQIVASTTNIVQITNISQDASLEQMRIMFGFLGEIVNIEMYDSDENLEPSLKVCFVQFANPTSVLLAQHLTNTIFLGRALTVVPYAKDELPDKKTALKALSGTTTEHLNIDVVREPVIERRSRDRDRDRERDRDRDRDRDRGRGRGRDRNHDRHRKEYSMSHRSRSRDREKRHRDRHSSRRGSSRDRSSRKRSRSRDSKRRRSRSSDRPRSRHHHK